MKLTLETVPRDAPLAGILAVLKRDGALILSGLMPADEADAICEELEPYMAETAAGAESFSGFKTKRTGALVARSKRVRAAVQNPRVLEICDAVLLPNASGYQVNVNHIIRILPGEKQQVVHRDRWSWPYLKEIEPQKEKTQAGA